MPIIVVPPAHYRSTRTASTTVVPHQEEELSHHQTASKEERRGRQRAARGRLLLRLLSEDAAARQWCVRLFAALAAGGCWLRLRACLLVGGWSFTTARPPHIKQDEQQKKAGFTKKKIEILFSFFGGREPAVVILCYFSRILYMLD